MALPEASIFHHTTWMKTYAYWMSNYDCDTRIFSGPPSWFSAPFKVYWLTRAISLPNRRWHFFFFGCFIWDTAMLSPIFDFPSPVNSTHNKLNISVCAISAIFIYLFSSWELRAVLSLAFKMDCCPYFDKKQTKKQVSHIFSYVNKMVTFKS